MTDRRPTRRGQGGAGFTLVELMIALVVIAIGVIALSGVQTRASNDVYSRGRQTRALALGQEQLEIARSAGYSAVAPDTGQVDSYNWITQVDSVDFELRRVTVTVTWPEQTQTRTLQLQTLISMR